MNATKQEGAHQPNRTSVNTIGQVGTSQDNHISIRMPTSQPLNGFIRYERSPHIYGLKTTKRTKLHDALMRYQTAAVQIERRQLQ